VIVALHCLTTLFDVASPSKNKHDICARLNLSMSIDNRSRLTANYSELKFMFIGEVKINKINFQKQRDPPSPLHHHH